MSVLPTLRAPLPLAVALLLALAAAAAQATTVPSRSLEELVAGADVVARVRVTSKEARRVGPGGRRIATFYEARVLEALKHPDGPAPAEVLVGLPGGVVGGVGQLVPGTPELRVGEEYVLFLAPPVGPFGARATLGLWQGVLALEAAAGRPRLVPYTHDGRALAPAALSLDELRARVGAGR